MSGEGGIVLHKCISASWKKKWEPNDEELTRKYAYFIIAWPFQSHPNIYPKLTLYIVGFVKNLDLIFKIFLVYCYSYC